MSGPLPPDVTPPHLSSTVPASGATLVSQSASVVARFDESIDPATVSASTFSLRGPAPNGPVVPSTLSSSGAELTLTPNAELQPSSVYTATVTGGAGGLADLSGNVLASSASWSFTTRAGSAPRPDPSLGPGGPVLVVRGSGVFGGYVSEILRAEGLNHFTVGDLSMLTEAALAPFRAVVLGQTSLTAAQAAALSSWITVSGGDLIALRPDPQLRGLLGLSGPTGTLSEGYLLIDTSSPPGLGIVGETIQFHNASDLYDVAAGSNARVVATLYSSATAATTHPAVTVRSVGSAGGSASAFLFDLAQSVVLTRQGNPAWVNEYRDGYLASAGNPTRADNLFYGAMVGDVQPDYVDPAKRAIPQADELQRLLANLLVTQALVAQPLPRFWYLPRGALAALVLTSDNHGSSGTPSARFDQESSQSVAGCSVADWQCVRSTSYMYASSAFTDAQAADYQSRGWEVALHPNTGCLSVSRADFAATLASQLAQLEAKLPSMLPPQTSRTHCIAWAGYTDYAEEEVRQGIHVDTNYYFWPPSWVADQPGLFTGSGFAQRFFALDGRLLDVYQATTQMTDESGQSYPQTVITLIENATGPKGFYGTFVANIHSGHNTSHTQTHSRGTPHEERSESAVCCGALDPDASFVCLCVLVVFVLFRRQQRVHQLVDDSGRSVPRRSSDLCSSAVGVARRAWRIALFEPRLDRGDGRAELHRRSRHPSARPAGAAPVPRRRRPAVARRTRLDSRRLHLARHQRHSLRGVLRGAGRVDGDLPPRHRCAHCGGAHACGRDRRACVCGRLRHVQQRRAAQLAGIHAAHCGRTRQHQRRVGRVAHHRHADSAPRGQPARLRHQLHRHCQQRAESSGHRAAGWQRVVDLPHVCAGAALFPWLPSDRVREQPCRLSAQCVGHRWLRRLVHPRLRHGHQHRRGRHRPIQNSHAVRGLPAGHLQAGILRRSRSEAHRRRNRAARATAAEPARVPQRRSHGARRLRKLGRERLVDDPRWHRLWRVLRSADSRGRRRRPQPHPVRRARRQPSSSDSVPDIGHYVARVQPVRREQSVCGIARRTRIQGQTRNNTHAQTRTQRQSRCRSALCCPLTVSPLVVALSLSLFSCPLCRCLTIVRS